MSAETKQLLDRAATELKAIGAREVYVFGSAARGQLDSGSDIDLAVSGLPPRLFYRSIARLSSVLGRTVDLVDLDSPTPFIRYLKEEDELVRVA